MQIVIDTNILVSALLSPNGKPAQLLNHVLAGNFQICIDWRIMEEYQNVLLRPKFHFAPDKIDKILKFFQLYGIQISAQKCELPFTDPDDKKFYEVAKTAHATLITGNLKHFPEDPIVKSIQEIL